MTHLGVGEAPYSPSRCDLFAEDWVDLNEHLSVDTVEIKKALNPDITLVVGARSGKPPAAHRAYMDTNPEPTASARSVDGMVGLSPEAAVPVSVAHLDIYDLQDEKQRLERSLATLDPKSERALEMTTRLHAVHAAISGRVGLG